MRSFDIIIVSVIACLQSQTTVSQAACQIPSSFMGTFYSEDISPYDKIVISSGELSLTDTMDDVTGLTGESVIYECQQILTYKVEGNEDKVVSIQVKNMDSMDYLCLHLEIMDENSNLLKWKETTNFADINLTSDYCEGLDRYRGHNSRVADGDFLFKESPVPTSCPHPLFNSTQSFVYEFDIIRKGRQTCQNDVNTLRTDASGNLEVLWQKCPNVTDLYYPPMNKTLTCFGSWKDETNAETILVADLNANFDINKYRCMWRAKGEGDGFLRLKMGQATEDCSMRKGIRRSSFTFALKETTSEGSRVYFAGFLLISTYFGAKSLEFL
ncbi:hypothetical protein CAPTEDRAFT_220220 [Capitella teleta]|uniref:DUF7042 domain-containing protein n=1 Tax=Capitella teleta TaxID=283909 RepID=R7UP49_CAPTE|nr:hypothetical protein CAPTEDRAFT_220220 [Capitella teleta]|eukprot:ELU05712.1 hypothetical protein CAPTEDRAFT_220220 [Capitella teleta]